MAVTLITKNSVTASKRPTAAQLVPGELGLNYEASDAGLYFEDSAGNIRKVGGAHYGATAPNAAAAGQVGNSVGELWYNTADTKLYIWDGAAWAVAGETDTQAFYLAGPWATGINRPDGMPLVAGDEWYDTSVTPSQAYVWSGASWIPQGGNTHQIKSTVAPTIRPDTTALQDGDEWYDSTPGQERIYSYDLATATWVKAHPVTFISDTLPPVAASFEGDLWFDSTILTAFVYYNDGTSIQWVQLF